MSLTIKTIAKKAGVSIATVSLALNNDSRVAEKTRKRVKKIADKLNYVPNNFGRALQSNRSRLVAYLLPNVISSFYSNIVQGIGNVASENNYGLLTAIASSPKNITEQLRIFREKRVDGIIVSSSSRELLNELKQFERSGIPIVMASSDRARTEFPNVATDNFHGGKLAGEHLIALGHRQIAFAYLNPGLSCKKRYRGCCESYKEHNFPIPKACKDESDLQKLLNSKSPPTAVFSYSDESATTVKRVAGEIGLSIPNDLSLVGFDNVTLAELPEYNLTTVAQDKDGIGRLAMELLLRRINGEKVKSIILKPELVIRGSTAILKGK